MNIADFRALPPRTRAERTIAALKLLGHDTPGMKARELTDDEIVRALPVARGGVE